MSENSDIFELINSYIQQVGIVDCQIDSYNDFILNRLNRTIEEENILKYEYEPGKFYQVKLKNAFVDKPTHITEDRVIRYITPNEARIRDLNYESNICVDLHIKKYEIIEDEKGNKKNITSRNTIHRHPIAKIPVMINSVVCNLYKQNPEKRIESGECKGDPGGYFIINGKERVIVAQERRNYNDVIILNKGEDYFADIRSMSTESGHSVLLQAYYSQDQLYFAIPNIDKKLPIGIVFKGFGLSNEEIETLFTGYDKYLKDIIKSSYFIENQEEALNYIGQFSVHNINEQDYVKYSDQILNYEILPHMSSYSKYNKIIFLKNMLTKLLDTVDGKRKLDERDNLSKKRIESTGILMSELFRTVYKNYIRKIQSDLKMDVLNTLSKYFNTVTKDIRLSFATGNWGSTRNSYVRNGVSQVLCRLSYTGMVSHLRRTNIPIGKEGKNSSIRQLHQSHAFFFCTAESPEGQAVGIVKNLAMTVSVTNKLDALQVKNVVTGIPGYQYINSIHLLKHQLLFINGQLYGYIECDINTFVNKLFKLRENKVIHPYTSIVYNKSENTIHIHTDEGRLIRPIINIENIDKLVYDDFEACLLNNSIVYRDAAELEMEVVAMTPKKITSQTRYLELHPCLMLGLIGNMIPFPDHNQAPRNVYYASMAKQVISLFANNYPQRVDTVAHVLHYPQKPIVDTKLSKISGIHDQPFGINAIVAIACYSSFNQEDSVILNKAAVDKGLFVSTTYKTITVEEKKKIGNTVESICLPDKEYQNNSFNYRNIDKNGLPKKGALLQVGDVIVGKVVTKISKDSKITYDNSVTVSASEEGIVDKIFITKSADNYKLVKIRIRSLRVPELGDKFASRSAQKGTVGMIFPPEDMPFTKDGIVPDIIINPHCMPSRMTISQLLCCVLNKQCTIDGIEGDCTPFSENSTNIVHELCDRLEKTGFERHGYEDMYNGMTGEKIKSKIFIGPTYYQKLKHMVADKVYARSTGNIQLLTQQPVGGRSKQGALRCGEMERDCFVSQGSSAVLYDRLYLASDTYEMYVCNQCQNPMNSKNYCNTCNTDDISLVQLPFSCKLLLQELQAMGIKIKYNSEQF